MKITVAGGGASGLMAAITAAQSGCEVTLLEKQGRVGRKLSVTGNGRCNLTNINADIYYYHGENPNFVFYALKKLGSSDTVTLFHRIGLMTVTDGNGRVYPFSDQATSVVDILRFAAERLGVKMITNCKLSEITPSKGGFNLKTSNGTIRSEKVIVCCGGAAGSRYGGTSDVYSLLTDLGHVKTDLHPSLVQIKTENSLVKSLRGVRADAGITVLKDNKISAESAGEVHFTDYGLSGPAAFEISRAVSCGDGTYLNLDFMRSCDLDSVLSILYSKKEYYPNLKCENLLTGILHNRLGQTVLRYCGLSLNTPLSKLRDNDLINISSAIKCFRLKIIGTMGFDLAQVTAGGIRTAEFNPKTLESKIFPGLYAAGEILDVDGDCGGFNLQWAWSSGRLAALSACSGGK